MNNHGAIRQSTHKLERTFYKELQPFYKEGMYWNAFIWRVNGNMKSMNKQTGFGIKNEEVFQEIGQLFQG